jgi:2-amino-4-hydroxy-6-hydroxymethyldihydropteridine diphosphokinase
MCLDFADGNAGVPKGRKTAYIAIGSNMGDRRAACEAAVLRIAGIPGCAVVGRSGWYWTEPVGVEGQERYLNGVVAAEAGGSPRDFLARLLAIEDAMGRERKGRWEPRTLDLDLLLYGEEIVREEGLILPHPLMHLRRFVLVPLAQIAPGLLHPVLRRPVAALLAELPQEGQTVVPWKDDE